ncbi:hypothetical protein D3C71_1724640 [compost metagenome]
MVHYSKLFQILCFGKLVAAFGVYIIHQNITFSVIEFEYPRTFHRILRLLHVAFPQHIALFQAIRNRHTNSQSLTFGFKEQMVFSLVEDDVAINAGTIGWTKEKLFRLSFQISKLPIGIGPVDFIRLSTMFH